MKKKRLASMLLCSICLIAVPAAALRILAGGVAFRGSGGYEAALYTESLFNYKAINRLQFRPGLGIGITRVDHDDFTFLHPWALATLSLVTATGDTSLISPFIGVGAGYGYFEKTSWQTNESAGFAESSGLLYAGGLRVFFRPGRIITFGAEVGVRAFAMPEITATMPYASLSMSFSLGGRRIGPAMGRLYTELEAIYNTLPDSSGITLSSDRDMILFVIDGYSLGRAHADPHTIRALEALAKPLANVSGIYLDMSGHTDPVGSETLNQPLSAARAQNTARILERSGCAPSRILVQGHGSAKPRSRKDREERNPLERRVEIRIREQR